MLVLFLPECVTVRPESTWAALVLLKIKNHSNKNAMNISLLLLYLLTNWKLNVVVVFLNLHAGPRVDLVAV